MKSSKSRMKLEEEVREVKRMREEGMTYFEIASKIGKSYAWVYTRAANSGYIQVGGAQGFKQEYVIPWLQKQEHMIVATGGNNLYYQTSAYADVVSRKGGVIYTWMIEPEFNIKTLKEGIGELTIHQWGWKSKIEDAVFGIMFPESERLKGKVSEELLKWIRVEKGIVIEFVCDKEANENENKQVSMD